MILSLEFLVLILAGFAAWVHWAAWSRQATRVTRLTAVPALRTSLLLAPLACLAVLVAVLVLFASFDVRADAFYILFYAVMGAAWVGLAMKVAPYLGVSARDDVIERGNRAALFPVLGVLLGLTLCFAGGNIGDGPGWWVVVFCALLSTGTLFGLWWILELTVAPSEAITVDRDPASGVRLGALLAAIGIILGRAVAGDWHSFDATVRDFAVAGWPAGAIALLAIGIEWAFAPTAETPARSALTGLPPAVLYLGTAIAWVAHLGDFR